VTWVVLIARPTAVAKRYEDLVCWQLANELEQLVFELTATGPAARDFKLHDQIRDSETWPRVLDGTGRLNSPTR
jgi:hypothetical protein